MKKIILIIFLFSIGSCTINYSMGDYTAISSVNVRGLETEGKKSKSYGEKCASKILFFWFGDIEALGMNTFGGFASQDLKPVIDEAIQNGRIKGVSNGDILVDARIKIRHTDYIIVGKRCLIVEGDLISSK